MPVSFATTTGERLNAVAVSVTGLTASTAYYANFTTVAGNNAHRIDFVTDGSGAATLSYTPQALTAFAPATQCLIYLKVNAAVLTSTNTFTAV